MNTYQAFIFSTYRSCFQNAWKIYRSGFLVSIIDQWISNFKNAHYSFLHINYFRTSSLPSELQKFLACHNRLITDILAYFAYHPHLLKCQGKTTTDSSGNSVYFMYSLRFHRLSHVLPSAQVAFWRCLDFLRQSLTYPWNIISGITRFSKSYGLIPWGWKKMKHVLSF